MNRKISLGAAISFMAVVAAITFTITMIFSVNIFNDKVQNVTEREELYKKVSEIDHLIRQNYVGELQEETLLDSLSRGFVSGTGDSYATYYDAETFAKIREIDEGGLVGIGAALVRDESGYIRLETVYEKSPADLAGLKNSDLIIAVNGQDVVTTGYEASLRALMDKAGTTVTVTYRRDNVDDTCDVLRKSFEMPVVLSESLGDGNVYIRITEFSQAAVQQFRSVINSITAEGATGVVFDLRNTAKGDLDSACSMLDLLVPAGDLVSAIYKDGSARLLRRSDANQLNLPMTVLINSKTQFAAELFAADMADYDKAKLVGVSTYGQGVIPEMFQLKDGSGVVLSNAYFIPAVGLNFNTVGLKPDYEVALSAEAEKSLLYRTLTKEDDLQLKKALEILDAMK